MSSLDELLTRYHFLKNEVALVENIKNPKRYKEIISEFNSLDEYIPLYEMYKKKLNSLAELKIMLATEKHGDMLKEIKAEIELEEKSSTQLMNNIQHRIVKNQENFSKIIMEVRAGTGGEEACLFAAEIFKMYSRFIDQKNWKIEIISMSESGKGVKEIVFSVEGKEAYTLLKNEVGTHRVQRIPETESQGRIHTSAITVAVLPFVEKDALEINEADLRIDTYRASGAGGQHVNTTDSAIRVTHAPTGIVVTCQEERSQLKNKEKALKHLRARLYQHQLEQQKQEETQMRKNQVGSGDRSEKIRTYNFPQARVSDHRIGYTSHNLTGIMGGDLEELLKALEAHSIQERLNAIKID